MRQRASRPGAPVFRWHRNRVGRPGSVTKGAPPDIVNKIVDYDGTINEAAANRTGDGALQRPSAREEADLAGTGRAAGAIPHACAAPFSRANV